MAEKAGEKTDAKDLKKDTFPSNLDIGAWADAYLDMQLAEAMRGKPSEVSTVGLSRDQQLEAKKQATEAFKGNVFADQIKTLKGAVEKKLAEYDSLAEKPSAEQRNEIRKQLLENGIPASGDSPAIPGIKALKDTERKKALDKMQAVRDPKSIIANGVMGMGGEVLKAAPDAVSNNFSLQALWDWAWGGKNPLTAFWDDLWKDPKGALKSRGIEMVKQVALVADGLLEKWAGSQPDSKVTAFLKDGGITGQLKFRLDIWFRGDKGMKSPEQARQELLVKDSISATLPEATSREVQEAITQRAAMSYRAQNNSVQTGAVLPSKEEREKVISEAQKILLEEMGGQDSKQQEAEKKQKLLAEVAKREEAAKLAKLQEEDKAATLVGPPVPIHDKAHDGTAPTTAPQTPAVKPAEPFMGPQQPKAPGK